VGEIRFEQHLKVKGLIGYFGLENWWLDEFNEDERNYIKTKINNSDNSLTSGDISFTNETVIGLLGTLACWFIKPEDRNIAHRILNKALEFSTNAPVLDVYFLYNQMIMTYYKDRNISEYMDKTIDACRKQIDLAPDAKKAFKKEYRNSPLPAHRGYKQLSIILEKIGCYQEAIKLLKQADIQGWAGDWSNRIERCNKKMKKIDKNSFDY